MENDNPSPEYVSGFNQGYLLARHTPEIAEKLTSLAESNPRIEGIKNGIEQYILEQSKNKMPDWLKKDRLAKGKQHDKDLDRE